MSIRNLSKIWLTLFKIGAFSRASFAWTMYSSIRVDVSSNLEPSRTFGSWGKCLSLWGFLVSAGRPFYKLRYLLSGAYFLAFIRQTQPHRGLNFRKLPTDPCRWILWYQAVSFFFLPLFWASLNTRHRWGKILFEDLQSFDKLRIDGEHGRQKRPRRTTKGQRAKSSKCQKKGLAGDSGGVALPAYRGHVTLPHLRPPHIAPACIAARQYRLVLIEFYLRHFHRHKRFLSLFRRRPLLWHTFFSCCHVYFLVS